MDWAIQFCDEIVITIIFVLGVWFDVASTSFNPKSESTWHLVHDGKKTTFIDSKKGIAK